MAQRNQSIAPQRGAGSPVSAAPSGDIAPDGHVRGLPGRGEAVVAGLGYFVPSASNPHVFMYPPPMGGPWTNCRFDVRPTTIMDARENTSPTSVHLEGFELRAAPTGVADFFDEAEVKRTYYKEVEELACAATGARRAYVFDHLVRKREPGRPALNFGRDAGEGVAPSAVGRIHNDYSERSGQRRLGLVLGSAATPDAIGRYSIVNVWRSIGGPVLDTPLAVCDARTVDQDDLFPVEIRYPSRKGEIYLLRHAPQHRWSYFSAMGSGEALMFKQYDSQPGGVARFTPHGAFDYPHVHPDTPLRQSIEVRCLVVYA